MNAMLPTDSALPHLSDALTPHAMLEAMNKWAHTRPDLLSIPIGCEIERIKFRPGRNCIIGYKLKLLDPVSGLSVEQRLCGGMYTPDEAHSRFKKALSECKARTAWLPAVFFIREIDMVCWTFPNERKLGALPAMTDTRHLKNALLPEVVKAKWGDGWEIHEISPQVVCYFPEHTCSIKVQLQLKDKQEGTRKTWEIYGKTRYDDAGAKVIQHMETLWKSSSNDVRYACPVHYQPEHKLLWQEKVPGTTLDSMLGQDNLDGSLLESVARAVAGLHRTPLTNLRPYTIETIVDRLKIAVDICQSTRPDTAPVVRRAMSKLLEHVAALDTGTTATLHGDLHSNNILVDGQQTYLIDMDRLSSGPPLAELGSFLAEIIYRACLRGQPVPWWQLARIFESYRLAVPWPVGEWELEWYTAAALIHERIFRCLTSIKPGRMEIVHTLADIADQMAPGNPGLCLLDQCAVNG